MMRPCVYFFQAVVLIALSSVLGCGVKGAPTPYVEAYPKKSTEVSAPVTTQNPAKENVAPPKKK